MSRSADEPAWSDSEDGAKPVPLRVLVVDDEQDNRASLAMLLDALGYGCRVATASDGFSALLLASTFRPHVVIMDLQMPLMGGHEAAQRMREQEWGRAIVLIAASAQPPQLVQPRPLEVGFDEHVLKPLDMSWIKTRMEEWLQRTEATRRSEPPAA